jgi:hypothetical protein
VNADPAVARVPEAARLPGAGAWIMVTIPGDFEGSDAISQRTSVVTDPAELTWLREVLALNAAGHDRDDDLD